jgi:MFS family permease
MFRALRHPAFRLLCASYLFINLGHWFATIGFQWLMPRDGDDDAMLLGLLYFCTFAPFLLFSLPAGALADSRDRRRILLASQTVALLLAVASTICAATGNLPVPLVLVFGVVSGCVVTLASPASQALTANTVPPDDLAGAISLQAVSLNLARIAGPMLAGPMLLAAGATGAFAFYSGTCLLVLALVSRVRVVPRPRTPNTEGVLARVTSGFRHARDRQPTMAALATVAVTSVFGCAFQSQLPLIGARISPDGDTAFLALLVCGGVGSLIGVMFVARQRPQARLTSAAVQLAVLGVTVILMGSVRSFPVMCVVAMAAGGLTFAVMTSVNVLIQDVIDDAWRGRVMSLYFICWGGLLPFGGLGIGLLIGAAGSPTAFAAFGAVAVVAAGVIGWRHRGA